MLEALRKGLEVPKDQVGDSTNFGRHLRLSRGGRIAYKVESVVGQCSIHHFCLDTLRSRRKGIFLVSSQWRYLH
ncbi:hypothetical protein J5N97_011523 [Dioscorea zingiberensis]|uniref:Uncharacterized protein n=1 Tax=Dioscorea zingiberensis TaxID=325984 RepID=A0A9D5HNQ0_9LILI|nr:hypothetical protein J5N97_011523 [Dioscorea zingiberensis]